MSKKHTKGVEFVITRAMIREYRKLSPEMRLAWLQDATILSYQGLTSKRRVIWQKFRSGDV